MTVTLTLGGIEIPPLPGAEGWWFDELIGWYDLTDDKTPIDERSQADGAFEVSAAFRTSAVVSFHVVIHAESEAELIRKHTLLASIGAGGPIPLRVADAAETTERVVTVRTASVHDHRGQVWNEVDFDCLARDPRRYSVGDEWVTARPPIVELGSGVVWPLVWPLVWPADVVSDGRVTLRNRGTRPSAPVFRVYGGFSSFALTNLGAQRRVSFDFPVSPGSFVELDFNKRTAMIDGVSNVSRYLGQRQWWMVPGGESSVTQIEVIGGVLDPYFAGKLRSAW